MIAMNRTVQSKTTKLEIFFDFILDEGSTDRRHFPHTFIAEPVYDVFAKNAKVVGILFALAPFNNLLNEILDENVKGVICVILDNCGTTTTYKINGPIASLELYESIVKGLCFHEVHIYPSSIFAEDYFTNCCPFVCVDGHCITSI
jgi:hypothetical protein